MNKYILVLKPCKSDGLDIITADTVNSVIIYEFNKFIENEFSIINLRKQQDVHTLSVIGQKNGHDLVIGTKEYKDFKIDGKSRKQSMDASGYANKDNSSLELIENDLNTFLDISVCINGLIESNYLPVKVAPNSEITEYARVALIELTQNEDTESFYISNIATNDSAVITVRENNTLPNLHHLKEKCESSTLVRKGERLKIINSINEDNTVKSVLKDKFNNLKNTDSSNNESYIYANFHNDISLTYRRLKFDSYKITHGVYFSSSIFLKDQFIKTFCKLAGREFVFAVLSLKPFVTTKIYRTGDIDSNIIRTTNPDLSFYGLQKPDDKDIIITSADQNIKADEFIQAIGSNLHIDERDADLLISTLSSLYFNKDYEEDANVSCSNTIKTNIVSNMQGIGIFVRKNITDIFGHLLTYQTHVPVSVGKPLLRLNNHKTGNSNYIVFSQSTYNHESDKNDKLYSIVEYSDQGRAMNIFIADSEVLMLDRLTELLDGNRQSVSEALALFGLKSLTHQSAKNIYSLMTKHIDSLLQVKD